MEKIKKQDKKIRTSEYYEKEGIFLDTYCLNPVTGRKMPIYAANFVLADYGTGCVMAVPTHDQRDFEFAKKYNLPLIVVIQPPDRALNVQTMTEAYTGEGILVNSGPFDGLENLKALDAIADHLASIGRGKKTVQYRLRDWGISRQRYWGAPIPMILCEACGTVPVPEKDLPVILPRDVEFTGEGGSPLAQHKPFVETTCPGCGKPARRETDTMDTFVESSWYFDRFCSARHDVKPGLDRKKLDYWMPVDQYIGGIEHAILHLLYARFYTKMLRDFGFLGVDEPFTNLLTQGMVCKETMRCPEHGYLFPEEVKEGKCTQCGREVQIGKTEKMSKSLKNVVDPDYLIQAYGADTARIFCLFASPPEKDLEWSDQGVDGSFRFLSRIWRIVMDYLEEIRDVEPYVIRKRAEQTIRYGGLPGSHQFYICSLSFKTLVYKGMLTSTQVRHFYPDLSDPLMESALAMVHSRFSTNTFPSWDRAHPYRYLAHNGEINTLRGNVNWLHAEQNRFQTALFGNDLPKILPVINPDGSDSAMFDNVLELLVLAGRSLPARHDDDDPRTVVEPRDA